VTYPKPSRRHGAHLKGCEALACPIHPNWQSCRRRLQRDAVGATQACDLPSKRLSKKRPKAFPDARRVRYRVHDEIDQSALPPDHRLSHLRQGKRAFEKTAGVRVAAIPEDAGVSHGKPVANQANFRLLQKRQGGGGRGVWHVAQKLIILINLLDYAGIVISLS
jgi:hypothetical protein